MTGRKHSTSSLNGSRTPRHLQDEVGQALEAHPERLRDNLRRPVPERRDLLKLYRVRIGGGEAEVLTDWRGEISDARPLADARLVAMVATDEPTEEDKRRRAERDDAFVWGQQLRCSSPGHPGR
jgi:hypothetical protein